MAGISQPLPVVDACAAGIKDFLKCLPEDEVHGLLKTTTGGLIACSSIEEASTVILRYSDAITLLNRKRVRKDYLLRYLHLKNVKIDLPADKTKLCRAVLEYWGQQNCQKLKFIDVTKKPDPVPVVNDDSKDPERSEGTPAVKNETSQSSNKPRVEVQSVPVAVPLSEPLPVPLPVQRPPVQTVNQEVQVALLDDVMIQRREEAMDYEESVSLHHQSFQTGQKLGEEFSSWFYSRLNSLSDFGDHHFWPECNLRIEYIRNNIHQQSIVEEILHDGKKCCEEVSRLKTDRQLFFNPNLIPGVGVRGKINPHGLAQVMVCGTLLVNGDIIGVFEQVFGLMMDPNSDNNFKIKYSVMRLRESNQIIKDSIPCLTDCSLAGILEDEEVDESDTDDENGLD